MNKIDLLKAHINSYVRKDGAVVQAYDNKVQKKVQPDDGGAPPLHAHVDKLRAKADALMKRGGGDWNKIETRDGAAMHSAADALETGDHEHAGAVIRSADTAVRDEILDHVHPAHWEKMGMKPLDMERALLKYEKMHGSADGGAGGVIPETKTNNEGYGFHGEAAFAHLRSKYGADDYYSKATEKDHQEANEVGQKKFSEAAHHLVSGGHFDNYEQARDYLDSTHGRHLHDAATAHDGDISKVPWLGKDVAAYKKKVGLKKSLASNVDGAMTLLKSHVNAYVRKDGTVVRAHETSVHPNKSAAMKFAEANAHSYTIEPEGDHRDPAQPWRVTISRPKVTSGDGDGDGVPGDAPFDAHAAAKAMKRRKA